MIAISNNAIENCKTINEVVNLINDGIRDASAEQIAASYAVNGEELEGTEEGEAYSDHDIEIINNNLDFLMQNGASFDYSGAQNIAIAFISGEVSE